MKPLAHRTAFMGVLMFVLLHGAIAQKIVKQVPIPQDGSNSVTVNPILNKIYVSGGASGGQVVAVVDGNSFADTTIGTGSGASVDTVTGRYWAAGVYTGSVLVRDGITNSPLDTVSLGYCPISAAADPGRRRMWVAAQCGGGDDPVWVINTDNYSVIAGPIGSGGVMGSMIVNPTTGRVYIGPSGPSERIDPTTFAVTSNSFGVVSAVNPITNRLYALGGSDSTLQIINGAPDPEIILATIKLHFNASGVGVNTRLNRIYLAKPSTNSVEMMDGVTHNLIGSIPLGSGVVGDVMTVDPTRNRIYLLVTSGGSRNLFVINDTTVVASVVENLNQIPKDYTLVQNYPNPFNPSSTISYSLPQKSFVTLKLYDLLGREVRTIVNGEQEPGNYSRVVEANDLPSGVYFYRLQAGTFNDIKKMLLLK